MARLDHMILNLNMLRRVRADDRPFMLGSWRQSIGPTYYPPKLGSGDINHPCGFAACVGGWMNVDPAHNALGFGSPGSSVPWYGDLDGIADMAAFWNVSLTDANNMALLESYPDYKEPHISIVIDRFEKMIGNYTTTERNTTSINQSSPT